MKKSKGKTRSFYFPDAADENRTQGPILAPGIGPRIKAVADILGTRAYAAKAAGVSDDMLYRYIREENPPSFAAMAGLAKAAGVRLDWLAFSEEPMRRDQAVRVAHLDHSVARDVIVVVEEFLRERGLVLDPEKKAELFILLYEDIREHEGKVDRAKVIRLVKLAAVA
jgi:transcriptional regulator with XRE-family HTH domain